MEDPKHFIGGPITDLPSPAFVINLIKVKENAQRMIKKCAELGISLRPHVKTHKTIEAALLQTGGKRLGIVVSTVQEAWFYTQHGFDDILLGRPVTGHVLQRCSSLRRAVSILFLVNSEEGLAAVLKNSDTDNPLKVLLKISTGYERSGIPWENIDTIQHYAKELTNCPGTTFCGLYVHCGNSYTTERNVVEAVRDESVARILSVRDQLRDVEINCVHVGIGSTPSCSLSAEPSMSQLTEVHPGNYVFYDCQQESYGSCTRDQIAGRVMTRVVSHHPSRNQILVDLGFTGLTKQGLDLAVPGFCAVDGHPNLKLVAMTQELGKLESVDGSKIDFSLFPVDSLLFLFPYHACATAGMYDCYFVHDDQGTVLETWRPTRGW